MGKRSNWLSPSACTQAVESAIESLKPVLTTHLIERRAFTVAGEGPMASRHDEQSKLMATALDALYKLTELDKTT